MTTLNDDDQGFVQVAPHVFKVLFDLWRREHDHADATSAFEHADGTRYFVDGWAGYAIRADGELVFVHAWFKGQGANLMASALANGAVYLDCFDGYLPEFYARHGFVDLQHVPNWTPGGPDVVLMALPGYADRHGVTA